MLHYESETHCSVILPVPDADVLGTTLTGCCDSVQTMEQVSVLTCTANLMITRCQANNNNNQIRFFYALIIRFISVDTIQV